jgi:hypothetical protein
LCESGLYDDAYALSRVLIEATVHLEFLTHASDWRMRIDTYAHFVDVYKRKKLEAFDEALRGHEKYEDIAQEVAARQEVVEYVFGKPAPLTWRIFPKEALPELSAEKKLKPTNRYVSLSLREEYDASLRQPGNVKNGKVPFLLDWVYFDGSSYVHTDVASLIGAITELKQHGLYDLATAAHRDNERHAVMIATMMALAALTAVQNFTGVSFGPRLDQLANRLRDARSQHVARRVFVVVAYVSFERSGLLRCRAPHTTVQCVEQTAQLMETPSGFTFEYRAAVPTCLARTAPPRSTFPFRT